MEKKLFKNVHYNTPGHAHEVTFSAYRRLNIFMDTNACEMLLSELETARHEFVFRLWAYVIMPNHVHLLIWPSESVYKIELINKAIKGRMAKRYIKFYERAGNIYELNAYRIVENGINHYRIWQRGGGFDRNLWNAQAIHQSIEYIEENPVRKKLAVSPERYLWSSAYARENNYGLVPDQFRLPVLLTNAQHQKVGVL
jgi:putative transposase